MYKRLAALILISSLTAVISVHARQAGAPLPPTLFPATLFLNVVGLSWRMDPAAPAPTGYEIHAGSAPGLSNLAIVNVAPDPVGLLTSFAAAPPPGTYYIRVVALNAAGRSAASNEIVVTVGGSIPCAPPGPPTGLTATVVAGGVTLRWNAGAGGPPAGYTLLVGSASGATNLGVYPVGLTTTVSSPAPNGPYFVRVMANNACGSSAPSGEVSFVIGGGAVPLAVPAGFYVGTVSNFNRPGRVPITSFTLQLNQPLPATPALQVISARWQDNRGCVKTTGIVGGTPSTGPQISLEAFTCNDGDFGLRITAVNGNVYSGVCSLGGPNCTFQMVRQ